MALQINFYDHTGLTVNGAYARIEDVRIFNDKAIVVHVSVYVNEQCYLDGKRALKHFESETKLNQEVFALSYTELYTHLKTLPEFSGAIDV